MPDTDERPAPPISPTSGRHSRARRANEKPTDISYSIVCVSIYDRDLAELDAKVDELKKRGRTDMNRSKLIRIALTLLQLDDVSVSARPE